jgi:hypothetical protein
MVDMDSRLRAARGIGADETQASIEVFQTLKERGHPDGPPPTISENAYFACSQSSFEIL